jgi:hypothetical protein
MNRKTVTILMPGETETRAFHLRADKADEFAAKVRAEGGTATVSMLALSVSLKSALARAGINADQVR